MSDPRKEDGVAKKAAPSLPKPIEYTAESLVLVDEKGRRRAIPGQTARGVAILFYPLWLGLYLDIESRELAIKDWSMEDKARLIMRALEKPGFYALARDRDEVKGLQQFVEWCIEAFDPLMLDEYAAAMVAGSMQRLQTSMAKLRPIGEDGEDEGKARRPSPGPKGSASSSNGSTDAATASAEAEASTT